MALSLFTPDELSFTKNALDLVTLNPFDPDWSEKGRTLLGLPFRDTTEVITWAPGADLWGPRSVYSEDLHLKISEMWERLYRRLKDGASASEEEWSEYERLSLYKLYCQYGEAMDRLIDSAVRSHDKRFGEIRLPHDEEGPRVWKTMWDNFRLDHEKLFDFPNLAAFPRKYEPRHIFACFFLFRRAFYHIFFNIIGTSKAIAKLRCAVWESIVTHDLLGWVQGLHQRMRDIPTLITGPSGTGKERVAEAIGRSLYIPFCPKKETFETDFLVAFKPVNVSALPPLLIEAELFGHVKGSFAGAVRDRIGRLEECPEIGAVFLDEIGELTGEIQVKLLRLLQERRFQRVGANEDKEFLGKIIAATNRDLDAEMRDGRFREDFYYRLCADKIRTPSLREQLAERPQDLPLFVKFVCRTVVGEEGAAEFARKIVDWIEQHLRGYTWPGNFRELEQCVRSYTIRKVYQPVQPARPPKDESPPQSSCDLSEEACGTLAGAMLNNQIAFEEIKRRLFTLVRRGTHTDKEAAQLLRCDSRTLQKYLA
jgi:DNA-binding NtrC family response regulator